MSLTVFLSAFGIAAAYRAWLTDDSESVDLQAQVVQPNYHGKLEYLALGDSYTIGEQVAPADRWPVQLAHSMRAAGIDMSDPVIIARTGWTTADLLKAMDQANIQTHFDLVTLLIGVNNQFQNRSTVEYRQQLSRLLQRSIALANHHASHVIVLSIPDWSVMPFAEGQHRQRISAQIDEFNDILSQECKAADIELVDVTAASRQATTQPGLIADDGLHPSAAQYAKWTALAIPAVHQLLPAAPPSR
jgi:lysophospholipase L1-like esterase